MDIITVERSDWEDPDVVSVDVYLPGDTSPTDGTIYSATAGTRIVLQLAETGEIVAEFDADWLPALAAAFQQTATARGVAIEDS